MVLANQMQVHLAANILSELDPIDDPKMNGDVPAAVDTATSLVLADYYIRENETDKAIAQYDKVLSQDPNHSLALTKRGALLLKKRITPALPAISKRRNRLILNLPRLTCKKRASKHF